LPSSSVGPEAVVECQDVGKPSKPKTLAYAEVEISSELEDEDEEDY